DLLPEPSTEHFTFDERLDSAATVTGKGKSNQKAKTLADNVNQSLQELNKHYKDLTGLQASVATESKESELQRHKKEALKLFVECTKTDLSLNNWVMMLNVLMCPPMDEESGESSSDDLVDELLMGLASGVHDPMLRRLAKCARAKDEANVCRNLHRLLKHKDFTLQVRISYANIDIKHATKRRHLDKVPWPVIRLSEWVRFVMETQGGQLLLAGHTLTQSHLGEPILEDFWNKYERVDAGHIVFSLGLNRRRTLPFMLHGDEGRGRMKQPLLIVAYQGILSHLGVGRLNQSGRLCPIG
ncbi:unnamed protein product, partial [Symbiodinium sp. CCMP2456]